MTLSHVGLQRMAFGVLITAVVSCGPDEGESGDLEVDDICTAAEADIGNVNGQNSLDENRDVVTNRVEFFDDVAVVAAEANAPAEVAEAATEVARRLEDVVEQPSNEDLQIALTDAVSDQGFIASADAVDQWVQETCPD